MSGRRATPADKQRVRTGCLTCRRRRRKCDERKPQCENCEVKGFACNYPAGVAFVPNITSERRQSRQPSSGTAQAYSKITFVVENEETTTSPTENDRGLSWDDVHDHDHDHDHATVLDVDGSPQNAARPATLHSHSVTVSSPRADLELSHVDGTHLLHGVDEPISHNSASSIPGYQQNTPSSHGQTNTLDSFYTRRETGNQLVYRQAPISNSHETELLRHFRYAVAPWIDVGDPESSFGIKVMLLAKANRPLLAAILALAALHKSLVSQKQKEYSFENSLLFREAAEQGLVSNQYLVNSIGKLLLLLGDFFCSSTLQWRSLVVQQSSILGGLDSFAVGETGLSESMFWVFARIDLAAAVAHAQRPIISLSSYPSSRNVATSFLQSQGQGAARVYQQLLYLLAACLSLIYDEDHQEGMAAHVFMRASNLPSRWTAYWNDCQKWYNDRPVELQQILEIRGVEADEINIQNSSPFPILVYTTPLALVANAIYHITSILLLSCKPRLLKNLPGPRCFTSLIWHAHSILGIVTSNEFPEQWDPVVIAGLLLLAKDMTHEAQQSVLLERFQKITTTTGINLSHEIESIQAEWNISRYGEEAIT